jgi:sugar/nucleoside kinase (ribokinase family)
MQDHDVVGIGNAIVDIIAHCDDAFLSRHNQRKGSMQLVDEAAVARLYQSMGPAVEISGGSCANTMVGIASLGGRAGFIGRTARDQFGDVFGHDIRSADHVRGSSRGGVVEGLGHGSVGVYPGRRRNST